MQKKSALIITSIAAPNAVMKAFAEGCKKNEMDFIVIGDVPSPADFDVPGCKFVSIGEQRQLGFRLASLLPERHYSRKNLGYLLAKELQEIIETDDDNFPLDSFWNAREKSISAELVSTQGWVNVYRLFTEKNIWPRGFPLEQIHTPVSETQPASVSQVYPIQQGLADENPDVDAVYRMTSSLPLSFNKRNPIVLDKNAWCPFNSQNTTWFKEAFPLLYLPSFCSFRMTDIWRSFIAQRIAWTCGWKILFHQSTVWQDRNEHNLLKDFADEVPGYLHNSKICNLLGSLELREGVDQIAENLLRCYRMMVDEKFIDSKELRLLDAWLQDIAD